MQQALGLDVRWVEPDELDDMNPAMAPGMTLGGSYAPGRRLHRPAAQRARLHRGAVHVRGEVLERTAFTGLLRDGDRVTGVRDVGRGRSPPSASC